MTTRLVRRRATQLRPSGHSGLSPKSASRLTCAVHRHRDAPCRNCVCGLRRSPRPRTCPLRATPSSSYHPLLLPSPQMNLQHVLPLLHAPIARLPFPPPHFPHTHTPFHSSSPSDTLPTCGLGLRGRKVHRDQRAPLRQQRERQVCQGRAARRPGRGQGRLGTPSPLSSPPFSLHTHCFLHNPALKNFRHPKRGEPSGPLRCRHVPPLPVLSAHTPQSNGSML